VTPGPPTKRKTGPGLAIGIGAFLAFQYGAALWRLAGRSGGMESKFSRIAVEDYRGYLVGQNLLVLSAYLLLGVAAWLLLMPVATWLRRHLRPLVAGIVGSVVLHGYFMFRLAWARPYFTGDATYGDWYYGILRLPPEPWRGWINGFAFDTLPLLALVAVLAWWFLRWGTRGRVAFSGLLAISAAAAFAMAHGLPVGRSGDAGDSRPPNVILIGSDSLRGDRLGFAGHHPPRAAGPAAGGVSPHIDRWAAGARIFEECRTPIGSTLESGVSVMTSTYPHTHGLRQMFVTRDEVEALDGKVTPLATLLRERGYDTAAIGDWCAGYYELTPLGFEEIDVSSFDSFRIYVSQAVLMAHFVVPLYFDNALGYRLFPQIRSFAQFVTPEVVTDRVTERLRRQAASGRPFFWHVFYSCNHLPYRAGEPYCRMFGDPDYDGPNAVAVDFDVDAFIGSTDLESKWSALPEKEARQIRALYDGCTRQFDANFGKLIEALEDQGLAANTIVILTADHGDDLYEPGVTLGHGLNFNGAEHSYHVPLAIRGPGGEAGRVADQVRTLDIAPTVAGLLGVEKPANWEGRDLVPGGGAGPGPLPYYGETQFPFIQYRVPGVERPALPPMDGLTRVAPEFNHQFVLREEYRNTVIAAKQRCLRTSDWKVVCTPDVHGERHYQLFHTATDPDSREDLAAARPEVLAPLRTALDAWIDEKVETPIERIFPAGEPAR
jgi:arylsulfatase A-like enzyme